MSKPMIRLFYCERIKRGKCIWELTTSALKAQACKNSRIATLEDVEDYGCVGTFYPDSYLLLDEGIFEFVVETYINDLGREETVSEYELIDNEKDILLDILEEMNLEDTVAYETIIGWSDWNVYDFLRKFDLNFSGLKDSVRWYEQTTRHRRKLFVAL